MRDDCSKQLNSQEQCQCLKLHELRNQTKYSISCFEKTNLRKININLCNIYIACDYRCAAGIFTTSNFRSPTESTYSLRLLSTDVGRRMRCYTTRPRCTVTQRRAWRRRWTTWPLGDGLVADVRRSSSDYLRKISRHRRIRSRSSGDCIHQTTSGS